MLRGRDGYGLGRKLYVVRIDGQPLGVRKHPGPAIGWAAGQLNLRRQQQQHAGTVEVLEITTGPEGRKETVIWLDGEHIRLEDSNDAR